MADKPDVKGEDEKVSQWLEQIELAIKTEKHWRDDAEKAIDAYRGEKRSNETGETSRREVFNILWANTEIKRQALYNTTPRPDIRKRNNVRDLVSRAVSEVLERSVSYVIDAEDVHDVMIAAVNDMLLPGRAITRLRTSTEFVKDEEGNETEEIQNESVSLDQVHWDDFIRGPGKSWTEVTWIAFRHKLKRSQIKKRFPEFVDKIAFDIKGASEQTQRNNSEQSIHDRATVYELWNKDERKVYWLAKGYTDAFLDAQDDPLELADFWPIPRPLQAIEDSSSLIPICEYGQYCVLAKELEEVTNRRNRIAKALRVRGVYDSTISEMSKVFESDDNDFIPAENLARMIEAGGLERAIWMLPIQNLITVFQVLGQQRQELIQQIYEITGISDIIRGDTNPNETLGAQRMKASFGSLRIDRQRQAVERYARDLIELIAEVVAEKFSRETITMMTGLDFPTDEQQSMAKMGIQGMQQQIKVMQQQAQAIAQQDPQQAQQMQQQIQQMQQQMQPQIDQAQQIINSPTWEQIESVMRSDLMREYKIDVETDSTVAADVQAERAQMTEFMNGMGQMFKYASDGINTGMITPEIARMTMAAFVRKFKLGRVIEDEIDKLAEQQPQQQPQNPQQQAEAQKAQMESQIAQQEAQAQQMEIQVRVQKAQQEAEAAQAEHQAKLQKLALEAQYEQAKIQKQLNDLMVA